MHIALPDLGLIAAVPPSTAGQPESIHPTDTAWAEAMLLDLGEVTTKPVAVPLALTPLVNPEYPS